MRYSVSAQHVVLGFMPGPKYPRQRAVLRRPRARSVKERGQGISMQVRK